MNTSLMKKGFSLKTGLSIFFSILIIGLVCYNMKDMIFGSPLVITTARDGATVGSPFLPITGTARHARELSINGRPITVDRAGSFNDEVLLSPGYNIVEVALKDQFGNQKVKTYQIVVTVPEAVATTRNTPYQ
jgi:hypothetical protein